ncbi:hypothetical protein BDP27DRAFT_1374692 [Rhodocollybia butyracea]|uniref:Uncharacterized protein n=1 Tax=Rhodocollybia butyracea TaxID=206335 RepID=A0A9P5P5Y0_9AGAR|nr:hypothetical protein BDP27DRAFT_1374692 [Rhodocollybia butyracea]
MNAFRLWASAMVAHREGVDMEHPPSGPEFSSQANNNDINDIALLACRHVGLLPQQQQPHITVNLAGLPDLLQRQPLQNLATNPNTAQRPPPRPKITLDEFCFKYSLSTDIQEKLAQVKVSGPHGLRYISESELMNVVKLDLGERGDVQDAVDRWMND